MVCCVSWIWRYKWDDCCLFRIALWCSSTLLPGSLPVSPMYWALHPPHDIWYTTPVDSSTSLLSYILVNNVRNVVDCLWAALTSTFLKIRAILSDGPPYVWQVYKCFSLLVFFVIRKPSPRTASKEIRRITINFQLSSHFVSLFTPVLVIADGICSICQGPYYTTLVRYGVVAVKVKICLCV